MAIITYPLNGITYDATDAETYLCTRTSGIFSADDCFNYTLTGNLEITIGIGIAWVRNAQYTGKSICNNAPVALSVPLGNSYNPRIDRVVLEFSSASNESTIKLLQGTAAASPTAPALTKTATTYQLGLYEIYVDRAATAITAANVTDTRLDDELCGLMRDSVESIPTSALYSQFMAWFADIQEFLNTEGTAVNSLALEGHPASYFATQADLITVTKKTQLPASNTALEADTIYEISTSNAVSDYTFRYPGNDKWAHGSFKAGNTNISFYPATYLNEVPTFITDKQYEFDVYDGVWAVAVKA